MRRYRYGQRRGGGNGSLLLVGILILAVAAGYAGTKYVIAPYILEGRLWTAEDRQESSDSTAPESVSGSGIVSGEQEIKDVDQATSGAVQAQEPESPQQPQDEQTVRSVEDANAGQSQLSGYAVQFGSFSTKAAAEQAVNELKEVQISASIIEKDGAYKVIGGTFDTKEKAAAEADRLRPSVEDVFVTSL